MSFVKHCAPWLDTVVMASSRPPNDIATVLQEIRSNAKLAEKQLWNLSYELRAKTEEAAHLRSFLLTSNADQPGQQAVDDVDDAISVEVALAKKRIAELEAERTRDMMDKVRLLKQVEHHFASPHATTLSEAHHFVAGKRPLPAARFAKMLRSLPAPNNEVLQAGLYFDFARGALSTAIQQHKRRDAIDVERAVLSGVAHTGQKLSMNVVLQTVTQADFDKL
jgi:hypothetical protein